MTQNSTLTDESEMPFGTFQHMKMANVPARYLLFLYDQPWLSRSTKPEHIQVKEYIKANLDVIQQQASQASG